MKQPIENNPSTAALQAVTALPEGDLLRHGTLLHAAGSVTNADTYAIAWGGAVPFVLKTFSRRPWVLRVLFTRRTLHHEHDVLRRLQGLEGIPRAYGLVGKDAMLMENIAGAGPLLDSRELDASEYPPEDFFIRLRALVRSMHDLGVSHGDMRRRNILIGVGNRPFLIDFATAIQVHGPLRFLRRRLYSVFRAADLFALAKLTDTYYPALLTDEDRQRLQDAPWHLRVGRFLRKRVYRRLIKQKRWRERWARLRGGAGTHRQAGAVAKVDGAGTSAAGTGRSG